MGMPFVEAAQSAKQRYPVLPAEYYGSIADETRRIAFTVSHLAGLEQIEAVMDSLSNALRLGRTLDEWKEAALLSSAQWGLSEAHLDTIARTSRRLIKRATCARIRTTSSIGPSSCTAPSTTRASGPRTSK